MTMTRRCSKTRREEEYDYSIRSIHTLGYIFFMMESLQADERGANNKQGHHHHHHVADMPLLSSAETSDSSSSADTVTTVTTNNNRLATGNDIMKYPTFVRTGLYDEMVKQVVRKKLAKQRHLVMPQAIQASYLQDLFRQMLQRNLFQPQTVLYNGGVANVPLWKISCYLEVMDGGVPTADPNTSLLHLFRPLLDAVDIIFMDWYRQQHACNDPGRYSGKGAGGGGGGSSCFITTSNDKDKKNDDQKTLHSGKRTSEQECRRLMTFITRYTPRPGEEALLKVGMLLLLLLIYSLLRYNIFVSTSPSKLIASFSLSICGGTTYHSMFMIRVPLSTYIRSMWMELVR
jgi:hypothetical protein